MTTEPSARPRPHVWMNGQIIPWDEAQLHVSTACALKGFNAFEGIRGYWSDEEQQLLIFRLDEHLHRLTDVSMPLLSIWRDESLDMRQGVLDVCRANRYRENVHIRPVVYLGEGNDNGYTREEIDTGAFVLAFPRGDHPRKTSGVRCTISSWQRISDAVQPPRAKAGATYLHARLAAVDARKKGFDTAIMLDHRGCVSEATNACLFLVRGGEVITPPVTASILESITRATVLELLSDELGVEPVVREIDRTELYVADEAFLCGTAVEVVPIREVDGYQTRAGSPGPLTARLQEVFEDAIYGRAAHRRSWITAVEPI